ncbi:hypothetical protein HK104_003974 [Borealophlyctis nickersoniae]|nr:hypothetical protein HK104_003974 [Borealophlyctis nickersoniae]
MSQNMHTKDFTTLPTFPPELYPTIVRFSHPEAGHNMRCLNRILSDVITQDHLVWGEFGWRWYHQGKKRCWVWAAKHGHLKVVEWLMVEEADDGHHRCWWEAGFVAVKFGRTEVVNALMGVSDAHERGRSAYNWYCGITEGETLDRDRVLQDEEIFDPEILPEWKEYLSVTGWQRWDVGIWSRCLLSWEWQLRFHLFVAARNGQVDMMKLLLQMGLPQERVAMMSGLYMPAAVHSGCLDAGKFLVDMGLYVYFAFDEAAKEGRLEMVEYCLPKWVEHPNLNDLSEMSFINAACGGHEEVVGLLLDRGIVDGNNIRFIGDEPEEIQETLINVALIQAAKNGHAATVRLLLNRGADAKAIALGGDGGAEVVEVLSA